MHTVDKIESVSVDWDGLQAYLDGAVFHIQVDEESGCHILFRISQDPSIPEELVAVFPDRDMAMNFVVIMTLAVVSLVDHTHPDDPRVLHSTHQTLH